MPGRGTQVGTSRVRQDAKADRHRSARGQRPQFQRPAEGGRREHGDDDDRVAIRINADEENGAKRPNWGQRRQQPGRTVGAGAAARLRARRLPGWR